MAKNEETSEPSWKDRIAVKYTEVKDHVERNRVVYYPMVLIGTVVVTAIVTRRVSTRPIFLAKKIEIKDSVLLIKTYERQQGPPSWVIRCLENDRIYHSQEHASRALNLSKGHLSMHLNNARPQGVGGYHFERVAIGLPRSG